MRCLRERLLALTQGVEAGDAVVNGNGEELTLAQAKVRLSREFVTFKRGEAHLKSVIPSVGSGVVANNFVQRGWRGELSTGNSRNRA